MIAVVGVLFLAGAGAGIALISAVAATHPDRAAMIVVLAAAAGGFGVFLLGVVGLLGVTGLGSVGTPQPGGVNLNPQRLAIGLAAAAALVAAAIVLIRTGDWDRHDEGPQP